jgi:hypothetical protein
MMKKAFFALAAGLIGLSAQAQEPVVLKGKALFGDMEANRPCGNEWSNNRS